MDLIKFATKYVAEKKIERTPIYSAKRFTRLMGDIDIDDLSDVMLKQFRARCDDLNLSAWTVKGTLKDLRTLIRANGSDVRIERIQTPEPHPQPVALDQIDAVWPYLAVWSRQWMAIAFWTALRFADTIRLQRVILPDRLEWTARKTRHRQRWPVPEWMPPFLTPVQLPYRTSDDHAEVICRAELERCCALAKIPRILPSNIRDTSLREWCRADFHVGQIVHGCRLGVIGHYVDVLDVLEPVAPRVRLPTCFCGGACKAEDAETALLSQFRRMDPAAKGIMSQMSERLSVG